MKNTILSKVFFLLFVIEIPLVFICFGYTQYLGLQLEKKIGSTIYTEATQFSQQLDESIKNIYISNMLLSTQSNIQNLVLNGNTLSTYQTAVTINTISEQLSNIVETNPFLSSSHIYYRDMKKVYHSANSSYGSFHDFTQAQWNQLVSMCFHPEQLHFYHHPILKKDTLTILIAPFRQQSPLFIIEFILDENYLAGLIQTQNTPDGKYILALCEKNIVSNLDSDSLTTLISLIPQMPTEHSSTIVLENMSYFYSWHSLNYANGFYLQLTPTEELLAPLQVNTVFLISSFCILIVSCIFFFFGVYRLVHRPLTNLISAFSALEHGQFGYEIPGPFRGDFAYLYHSFNNMSIKLADLIERDYNQKNLIQKAELKQLQAQINPHFLYNSFFLVQTMLKAGEIAESSKALELLAKYFRYITKNSMDYVSLKEEYNHAKIYIALQSLRFKQRISIQTDDLPSDLEELLIPKMVLQPILENSFKYGLKNKINEGIVRLTFNRDAQTLRISIEDNGEELTDETLLLLQNNLHHVSSNSYPSEMSGLLNIHRRLSIYDKSRGHIEVSRSTLGGLRVDVFVDAYTFLQQQ